ncbi:MAG: SAM-dependent methyltransferase [Chloroflexota bacterium]|nr:SAM-dependent methyltransferase [Chloroflexota bacterium]
MAVLPDEFESVTESAPLVTELRERIAREGAITFRDFMAAALYDPKHGYYMTAERAMSRGGDYVTSPEVHSIFGSLVAKQLFELWETIGRPPRFDIVEQGAGTGLLARDILRWSARVPEFAAAISYRIVEISAALARVQRETLRERAPSDSAIEWLAALPPAITGCVLSNELVDAFPVHRIVREGDELREVFVTWRDGRFVDEPQPLSDPALRRYFDDLGLLPGDGCYAEVNLDAPRWITEVAQCLERGYVLTFDYGYEAAQLYAPWRRDGTLLCFYRQSASSDPYQRLGKQDMTASVDFTTLRLAGERCGLRTLGMTVQSQFLVRLGISEGIAAVAGEGNAQMEEYFARRRVVMDLIDPGKLGRVKVLLQGKGVPETRLRGFNDD